MLSVTASLINRPHRGPGSYSEPRPFFWYAVSLVGAGRKNTLHLTAS